MFGELELKSPDIMLSGGATGADTEFGKAAHKAKHQVVHWMFKGHKTKLKSNLYELSVDHLKSADPFLIRANKSMRRTFPGSTDYVNNLLRRNYYQVKWSDSVYAVGNFGSSQSMLNINGGTEWACQMYVDRFLYDQEPFELCNLFFFDQTTEKWHRWHKVWTAIDCPPIPTGIYAGIGTRDISDAGITAIKELYSTRDAAA